eukprot:TRINITY_DN7790_c0_g1_i1.p1 TRINITY_DN7790_c0_g1~~TRINITY_DN7790_c0_g1_i1.p1  ORF type:complete len:654 (+),score=159.62 TRINITY_DN7790_c0_g1_i1:33-1964(+)
MDKEGLAAQSYEQFRKKEYDRVAETLRRFKKSDDPKHLHNIALTQYYMSGCTEPYKFLEELQRIQNSVEEKADNPEASASSNNNASSEGDPAFEAPDTFLLAYNQAVIYYHLKKYGQSQNILDTLFQNIEPVDEYLAIQICFLLIDVHLLSRQTSRIPPVIAYLDKTLQAMTREKQDAKKEDDKANQKEENGRSSSSPPILPADFKYNLHLYKAKYYLTINDANNAKSELKNVESTTSSAPNPGLVLFLNAQLDYLRQDFNKSTKTLNSWQKDLGNSESPMYFNNLGCISFRQRKLNMASFHLVRALKENEKHVLSDTKSVHHYTTNKKREIMYNMGNQLLFSSNPELAFRSFQEAVPLYMKQPTIWLRLAECCIHTHQKKLKEAHSLQKNGLVKKATGVGKTRRIILPESDNDLKVTRQSTTSDDPQLGLVPSIAYGSTCLRNAMYLYNSQKFPTSLASPLTNLPNNAAPLPSTPSHNFPENSEQLYDAILLNAAYVSLVMNDPLVALSHCRELLARNTTDKCMYLANMYAAEALVSLGKADEAVQHLDPKNLGLGNSDSVNFSFPNSVWGDASCNPRHVLYVNLAVVHILKEELQEAYQKINQALSVGHSTPAVMMQVYLELRNGNADVALQLLKVIGKES